MNSAGRLVLPWNLVEAAGPQEQAWLATVLPVVVEQARELWSLALGDRISLAARPPA
jgi:hypothetical protein